MKHSIPLWPAALCGVLLVGLGSGLYVDDARAESKDQVTIQVRLLNNGAPMNEELDLTFEIYNAETDGTLLWTEDQDDVLVRNGILVARLGAVIDLDGVFKVGSAGSDRWVAIKQGATEIVPRILITAVPYAQGSSAAEVASSLYKVGGSPVALAVLADELAGAGLEGDSGSPEKIQIAASAAGNGLAGGGGVALEVDEAELINGGDAEVDGDRIAVDYSPTNYTATIAGQALNTDELTAHLKGIDDKLTSTGGGDPDQAQGFAGVAGGRLTLSSADSVPTTDQSNKGTLYYLPHRSGKIALWNTTDSEWEVHEFTSVSDSEPGGTGNYDVFMYHDGNDLALDFEAWGSDTSRSSVGISLKEGVLVKGTTTQSPGYRYLGTVRVIDVDSTRYFIDTEQKRFVWNVDNQVRRTGANRDDDDATITTVNLTSWVVLDNDGDWKFEFVRGLDEDPIRVDLDMLVAGASGGYAYLGICLDTATSPDAADNALGATNAATSGGEQITLGYRRYVGIGYHTVEPRALGYSTFYLTSSWSIMRLTVIG